MVQVRSSKYRHVYGDPTRKDKCYDNIHLTKNAFDSNLVKTNGKYLSLNWDASGGGSFAVIPTAERGKLPDRFPLFDGHKGAVLDTDWNPFDDEMVVSASDDGTIGIWRVPEDFSVHVEYGKLDDCKDVTPVKFLEGHGKKVGHVGFNPVAENVLASTSLDNTVKIWDIESGDVLFTLKHPAFVTSFSWNYDGTKIATVAKDKQIRIWDVRAEKVLSEGKGHAGAKGSRIVWLGDNDRVLTTGFSLFSDREMALWDTNNISAGPIDGFRGLDPSSGIVIPHYDPMTSVVYLGGRGDGKIVYFEYADDTLYDLFAYNSTSPQRGLGWAPLRSLLPKGHEVARVYKVHDSMIEPIPFRVPLKQEGFLDNVYTYADAGEPSLTAKDWKAGKTSRPLVKDWKSLYEGSDAKAKEAPITPKDDASSAQKNGVKNGAKATESKTDSKSETKVDSKAVKSEPKTDSKTDAKSDPKAEPKTSTKTEAQSSNEKSPESSAKNEEIAALKKSEKQDSYDVLQSDEVKSFLAKNSEKDEDDTKPDTEESTWDDEPQTTRKSSNKSPAASDTKSQSKKEDSKKEDSKKEDSNKKTDSKTDKKKSVSDDKPLKEEAKKEESKKEEPKKLGKHEESKLVLDEAAKASSDAADAAQKASDAAKASSESVSKAASASTTRPTTPISVEGSLKLDEILGKLDSFNQKMDSLSKRLEALEKRGN